MSNQKIKAQKPLPIKRAFGLLKKDGGYSVVKYEIIGDKAVEVEVTEPNLLEISLSNIKHEAVKSYQEQR